MIKSEKITRHLWLITNDKWPTGSCRIREVGEGEAYEITVVTTLGTFVAVTLRTYEDALQRCYDFLTEMELTHNEAVYR